MRVRLVRRPGQHGTREYTEQYGDRLICVRYRYDATAGRRYKTIEIIVDEALWAPPAAAAPPHSRPRPRSRPNRGSSGPTPSSAFRADKAISACARQVVCGAGTFSSGSCPTRKR